MTKTMTKSIVIFTLALLALSMVGAAATTCSLCKANGDSFQMTPTKHCGNVLSNDIGNGVKVISRSKTTNGGIVTMQSNGHFCYKPISCSMTIIHDSFTYKIKSLCGQISTARVSINYRCH
jgi:hypothetical protein